MSSTELIGFAVLIILSVLAYKHLQSPSNVFRRRTESNVGNLLYLKISELENERDAFHKECIEMERTLITYERHIDDLMIELRFYGDIRNYEENWSNGNPILKDKGERARKILEKLAVKEEG
jgi:hypothetical protein